MAIRGAAGAALLFALVGCGGGSATHVDGGSGGGGGRPGAGGGLSFGLSRLILSGWGKA